MALGFGQLRLQVVAEAAREWRGQRYLPLYAAGILLGAGIGLGLTVVLETPAGESSAPVHEAPPPPVVPPANIVLPSDPLNLFATPGLSAAETPHDQLGVEFLSMFEPLPPPLVTPAAAPVEPPVATPQDAPIAVQPEAPAVAPPVAEPEPAAPAPATARPNFYIPASVGGNAAAEQALFDGINAERAAAGLAPYVLDAGLAQVARIRSQQLIDQDYFAHIDPYGYRMYAELLGYFGYSYAWAGENLAMNNYAIDESPTRALISLMNSPTHRANILAGDFSRIGIGEVSDAAGHHYFTMVFLG
jgi:uncharacterized protein YkwD